MNRRQLIVSGASFLSAACARRKAVGFNGHAFIASEGGKAIAVVDMGTFTLVRQIPLEGEPTAVISHPSRPFLYVLTPLNGTVHEVNTETLKVTRKTRVAATALAMRIDNTGSALWVLNRDARKLVRLDLNSFHADSQIPLPLEPSDFDLSRFDLCAVSYGSQGSVGLIDVALRRVTGLVRIGQSIGTARFRQDGRALMIANTGDRMLSILETPGGKMIANLPLAVRPDNFCFNPNGGQLFITGEGMDVVVVVFPYRIPEVKETVLAGRAPGAMCASEQFLFIANPTAGSVSIFDIKTRKVIAATAVGSAPGFIALTPGDQYALVLNRDSGDMAVIRLATISNNRRKQAALFTMIPVGSRPVSAVVRSA